MADLTLEEIEEACLTVLHTNKQLQFLEDREAARIDDINNNRGYLVLNPELENKLTACRLVDVHGSVIEKDGVEYRVIVDEKMRGMTDIKTGEMRHGWWIAPQKSLPPLAVSISKTVTPKREMVRASVMVHVPAEYGED